MKDIIKKLLKQNGGFLQSTSQMVAWVFASQVLMFVCIPVISRLYSPDSYGIYAIFASIMYVFNQVVGLRSEQLINLPKRDEEAETLLATSFTIVFSITIILTFVLYICPDSLIQQVNLTEIKPYLYLIPCCALIIGLRNSFLYWAIRQNQFGIAGIANFLQAPGMLLVQISVGYYNPKAIVLIWGAIASWSLPLVFLVCKTVSFSLSRRILLKLKLSGHTIRINWDFLCHATLSILLLSITNYLPVILVSTVYSTDVAAWFALAMQAVYSPMDLISMSISQVYLNKGAKILHNNANDLAVFYVDLTKKLFLIGLIPISLLALFGGQVFQLVFGNNWFNAGLYAQTMSFMLLFRFAIISTSQNMVLLKKQRQALIWSIVLLLLMVSAFLPAYLMTKKPAPEFTLILFSINLTIGYIIYFCLNLRTIKKYVKPVNANQHNGATEEIKCDFASEKG